MKTVILKISRIRPEKNKIKKAAQLIKKGKLVAFPTETVYGLGADALNASAVKKIFKVKKRQPDNPLIVHISKLNQAKKLVKNLSKDAKILAKNFWPGPLTLVLEKNEAVPDEVTAKLSTIAIRMPNNKIALSLISKSKCPISAPSANSSGKPSPTKAEHVFQDLKNKIPLIIDGGKTDIGIESTIIDLTSEPYKILRPGKITKKQIEKVLRKKIEYYKKISKKALAPGMKYKHYSPNAKVILVTKPNKNKIEKIISKNRDKKIGLITFHDYKIKEKTFFHPNLEEFSRNLFSDFREFDKLKYELIIVEALEEKGFALAIMNRIKKAADKII